MSHPFVSQSDQLLAVGKKTHSVLIRIETIAYLKCDTYVTTIYLIRSEKIRISRTLKSFGEELAPYGFLRLNHNILVNPQHITTITCGARNVIVNGRSIAVSRRRRHLVRELISGRFL